MTQPDRRPIVIIQTGVPPASVAGRHGDFSAMILRTTGLSDEDVRIVPVHEGTELADPTQYAAAIITGSPAMVTDQADWSERTAAWIREALPAGLPMFGICYGHQLMAHAFGGQVGYHPAGRQVGTRTSRLTDAAQRSATLMGDMPEEFVAHLIHEQSVVQKPSGATVLVKSESDPHQVLAYSDRVLSTQFHPEFSADVMATYVDHFSPKLAREGFEVPALIANVRPTPDAQDLLRRFARRYAPGAAAATTGSISSSTP